MEAGSGTSRDILGITTLSMRNAEALPSEAEVDVDRGRCRREGEGLRNIAVVGGESVGDLRLVNVETARRGMSCGGRKSSANVAPIPP